ncbi:MAG TPA: DUF4325 domain-containing protein [bacterium]|jgi:anti-sigma regulatory factor (Ser/Thr protein kinase)|nr:DUF4325 domain-containing protein [bacterium]
MFDKKDFIKKALLLISQDGRGVPAALASQFGLSRQTVHNQLQALVRAGQIASEGHTRGLRYRLLPQESVEKSYECRDLSEDRVWSEAAAPLLMDLPENVRDIWHYGITEIVNNAIDHSESPTVSIEVQRNALFTDASVSDRGIGIFFKIQQALGLYDPRAAILELSKGKFTTDPKRHSGEGIFFSSKVFDNFNIRSRRLTYAHNIGDPLGTLSDHGRESDGTVVRMRLQNDSGRLTKSVFDEFAAPEAYTFAKTLVPVRLAQYEGEKLVSRSQAKRLTLRFEQFSHVVLDFEGVSEIGQAFGDELFRVFAREHPAIELSPVNMTTAVEQMVLRARAA